MRFGTKERWGGVRIPAVFDGPNPEELLPGSEVYEYYQGRRLEGNLEYLWSMVDSDNFHEILRDLAIEYVLLEEREVLGEMEMWERIKLDELRRLFRAGDFYFPVEEVREECRRLVFSRG